MVNSPNNKKLNSKKLLPHSINDKRSRFLMDVLDHALKMDAASLNIIDYDNVPATALDALIYDFDLQDFLTDDAPDIVKRRLLKDAKKIKAMLGYRPAITNGLKALGIDIQITEWWQAVPQATRVTFEVICWVNEQIYIGETIINQELHNAIERMISRTKRKSQHHSFKVGAKFTSEIKIAAATTYQTIVELETIEQLPGLAADLNVTATVKNHAICSLVSEEQLPILESELNITSHVSVTQIVNLEVIL